MPKIKILKNVSKEDRPVKCKHKLEIHKHYTDMYKIFINVIFDRESNKMIFPYI